MRIIPKRGASRRISDQAPPEARRLYALARAFNWVAYTTITVVFLLLAMGFLLMVVVDRDHPLAGPALSISIVCLLVGILAAGMGDYFTNKLEREFPGQLVREGTGEVPMSATSQMGEGVAEYFGVDRATVATAVGDCHLLDDITRIGWPRPIEGSSVFADEDLRIAPALCACGRLYLEVWRRVPRSYFEYLVPLEASELSQVRSAISRAPRNVTDKWLAAERAVTTLARTRPTIEYSFSPPEILRWLPPGELLAFTTSPF